MNDRRAFFRELARASLGTESERATAADPVAPEVLAAAGERYAPQVALPEWGPDAQARLQAASVLVVGAGALGAPVALYLAAAGVGRLGIVDPGTVELSALHRQLLHFTPDAGQPKAHTAAAKLGFLNPDVRVEPYQAPFGPAMLTDQDLVVDCTGSVATHQLVNDACCAAAVPLIGGDVAGLSGIVLTVLPGLSACYRCAFSEAAPEPSGTSALGAAAGVVGSLMALEAMRVAGGLEPTAADAFLEVDLMSPAIARVAVERQPDCPGCAGVP